MNNNTNDKGANNMSPVKGILEKNRKKLWDIAKNSNKYNEKDQCLISRDDEDFHHNEWEDDK